MTSSGAFWTKASSTNQLRMRRREACAISPSAAIVRASARDKNGFKASGRLIPVALAKRWTQRTHCKTVAHSPRLDSCMVSLSILAPGKHKYSFTTFHCIPQTFRSESPLTRGLLPRNTMRVKRVAVSQKGAGRVPLDDVRRR